MQTQQALQNETKRERKSHDAYCIDCGRHEICFCTEPNLQQGCETLCIKCQSGLEEYY